MRDAAPIRGLEHLPRLCAALSDVLGIHPAEAHANLDMAEALACDDLDRTEVLTTFRERFAIPVGRNELDICESVADLLRLIAAKHASPWHAYA